MTSHYGSDHDSDDVVEVVDSDEDVSEADGLEEAEDTQISVCRIAWTAEPPNRRTRQDQTR